MMTHEEYKWETDNAISWLINKAIEQGSTVRVVEPPGPRPTRPKGKKAREETRQAAANTVTRRVVTPAEIISQANYLAGRGEVFPLHRRIWRSFGLAIHGREQYARRHVNSAGNAGHVFFINTLKQAVRILAPFVKPQSGIKKTTDSTESDPKIQFGNFFNLLEKDDQDTIDFIYEKVENGENIPTSLSLTSPIVVYEPELDPWDGLLLEWTCFIDHVGSIRDFVVTQFMEGGLHQDIATFIIEAALVLVEKKIRDLVDSAERITSEHLIYAPDPNETLNWTIESITDITSMLEAVHGYPFPIKPLRERKPAEEHISPQWELEDKRLIQLVTELGLENNLRQSIYETPASIDKGFKQPLTPLSLDLVSRVLMSLTSGTYNTITKALAAEILLSISMRKASDTTSLVEQVSREAEAVEAQMATATKYGLVFNKLDEPLGESGRSIRQWVLDWPLPQHKYIQLRLLPATHPCSGIHRHYWALGGLSDQVKAELLQSTANMQDYAGTAERQNKYARLFVPPCLDSNALRQFNPLYCIKPRLPMRFIHDEFGVNFANSYRQLPVMCHLYNGLCQLGRLTSRWPAMEEIMNAHIQSLFSGELPTNPEDFYSRLLLASGVPAASLRKLKQQRSRGENPDPAKIFEESTKNKNKSDYLEVSPLTRILRDYFIGREQDFLVTLYKLDNDLVKLSGRKDIKSFIDSLGVIEFLQELEKHLPATMSRLQIDYLGLTCNSNDVLRQIATAFEESSEVFGPATSEADWRKPSLCGFEVVLSVFGEQVDRVQASRSKKKRSEPVATPMTDIAVKKIEEFLQNLQERD